MSRTLRRLHHRNWTPDNSLRRGAEAVCKPGCAVCGKDRHTTRSLRVRMRRTARIEIDQQLR